MPNWFVGLSWPNGYSIQYWNTLCRPVFYRKASVLDIRSHIHFWVIDIFQICTTNVGWCYLSEWARKVSNQSCLLDFTMNCETYREMTSSALNAIIEALTHHTVENVWLPEQFIPEQGPGLTHTLSQNEHHFHKHICFYSNIVFINLPCTDCCVL